MSNEALMTLAKEATGDFNALLRVQALTDNELLHRGLDQSEIAAVRQGFFEKLALAGSFEGDEWRPNGCCGG